MKTTTIGKVMALALAMVLTMGSGTTAFACEDCNNHDGSAYAPGEHGGFGDGPTVNLWPEDSGSSDSGSSDSGSYDDSYDDGGSYDSGSYDDGGSYDAGSYDDGGADYSYDAGGSDSYGGGSDATAVAPEGDEATDTAGSKGYTRNRNRLTVDGFETALHLVKRANGSYTVKHMGQDAYMAQLLDAAGNETEFKGAGMYRAEDGRLFINIVVDEAVDTTGYKVSTWKGDAAYLPKLGISGVCLNKTIMVDADAMVAAQAAAATVAPVQ